MNLNFIHFWSLPNYSISIQNKLPINYFRKLHQPQQSHNIRLPYKNHFNPHPQQFKTISLLNQSTSTIINKMELI